MTTATATLEEAFDLATRLTPADKLRLVARLMPQVVPVVEPAATQVTDFEERLQRFRAESLNYTITATPGEVLEADRWARDAILMGRPSEDVHA